MRQAKGVGVGVGGVTGGVAVGAGAIAHASLAGQAVFAVVTADATRRHAASAALFLEGITGARAIIVAAARASDAASAITIAALASKAVAGVTTNSARGHTAITTLLLEGIAGATRVAITAAAAGRAVAIAPARLASVAVASVTADVALGHTTVAADFVAVRATGGGARADRAVLTAAFGDTVVTDLAITNVATTALASQWHATISALSLASVTTTSQAKVESLGASTREKKTLLAGLGGVEFKGSSSGSDAGKGEEKG